jgi:hypothetical protein
MLRDRPTPDPAPDTSGPMLTCGDPECQHTVEPDRHALASGSLACPECDGWAFQARLVEPRPAGGEGA